MSLPGRVLVVPDLCRGRNSDSSSDRTGRKNVVRVRSVEPGRELRFYTWNDHFLDLHGFVLTPDV